MSPSSDWTERGQELGASLDACHAIVVVGADPIATSNVALGLARTQAAKRRVAVVDLIGDAPPLQELVTSEDPHGIVDSFVFGVSLNKIANPVADTPNLFVMPSGSTPIDYDELFPSPRWGRLSGGFREVGALMVLVAPFDAPHMKDLVAFTDGVVIVGENAPADIAVAHALAWLRPRRPGATPTPPRAISVPMLAPPKPMERGKLIAGIAGIGLALLIAAAMFLVCTATVRRREAGRAPSPSPPTAPVAAPILRDTDRDRDGGDPRHVPCATSGTAPIDTVRGCCPSPTPASSSQAAALVGAIGADEYALGGYLGSTWALRNRSCRDVWL